ncbi:hypothetical protein F4810DRAFT_687386 [Camillea tinctor]|nr:hypothetical protein F4810DRAFT_687386 [Camillea tinctor]
MTTLITTATQTIITTTPAASTTQEPTSTTSTSEISTTQAPITSSTPTSSGVAPARCYAICNNAFTIAQAIGRSPALCELDGEFAESYSACLICVGTQTQDTVESSFAEYVDYCNSLGVNLSSAAPATSTPTSIALTAVVTVPTVINDQTTTWMFTTTYASLAIPGQNGTNGAPISTTASNNVSSTETAITLSETRSQAWIAGPIVGSVAGVALILLTIMLLWQRKRKRARSSTAQELHGETAKKSELHGTTAPQEIDGYEASNIAELPVDNFVTQPHTEPRKSTSRGYRAPTGVAREKG